MKFAITGEHRLFYQKHHAIELEGLCSPTQLKALETAINLTLAERMGLPTQNLGLQEAHTLFGAGRDLWRSHPALKKLATQSSFADIAATLTEQHPLRLGYDQFFPSIKSSLFVQEDPYSQFLQMKSALEEVSSLQGVVCGLMLCLNQAKQSEEETQHTSLPDAPIHIFPQQAGNGIFFSPKAKIDWPELFKHEGQRYLMIVYTQAKSVYVLNEADPQVYALKQWGYSLGDRLSDKLNPIVHK